ncbi:MAG: DUF1214 domain-containing protein [Mycobacterium sp.]
MSPDNFVRAASDTEFTRVVNENGFGRFFHNRDVTPIDHQPVTYPGRDTLYSAAVFDLQAAPVTITLPEVGDRFMSMQVISEDEYVIDMFYGAGAHTLTRNDVGTRYAMVVVRILSDPKNLIDLAAGRDLQDRITSQQDNSGIFEVPRWDSDSQKKVTDALITLAETIPDTTAMFGTPKDTDPVRHLIGAALAWGSSPERDTIQLNVIPLRNDGRTVYRLSAKDVPVEGFWSISVYNKNGYFAPNPQQDYAVNNLTATKAPDGSVTVQFGGCTAGIDNCLPTTPDWSYLVRLYRPEAAIRSGDWTFPESAPVS